MTEAIILCAGSGERWGGYLGVPKQLVRIGKEALLDRTVRLLRENGVTNIHVVSNDERLKVEHVNLFSPALSRWTVETLLSTRSLWAERTVVLLGDVFYSEDAMRAAIEFDGPVRVFGRSGPSWFTSCEWAEIFAVSFTREAIGRIAHAADCALQAAAGGGKGKLWQMYYSLLGSPMDEHRIDSDVFFVIDDFTDDFDSPEDYDSSVRRYRLIASGNRFARQAVLGYAYSLRACREFVKSVDRRCLGGTIKRLVAP